MRKLLKYFVYLFVLSSLMMIISCLDISDDEPWSEIFLSVIDSDGNNLTHLIEDVFGNPKFSYNAEKIIIAYNGFWTMNCDGSEYSQIIEAPIAHNDYFSVSPISDYLVFRDLGGIYRLNYLDGEVVNLTGYTEESLGAPSYSPDGEKIIFPKQTTFNDYIINEILVMNPDGSDITTVLRDSVEYGRIYHPIFTSDMNKIIYSLSFGGLYMCNSDGSQLTVIYNELVSLDPISTRGDYIVFKGGSEIYSFNYTTNQLNLLDRGSLPVLSPVSNEVIYHDYGLFKTNIDGSNTVKLAESSCLEQSFSPDGSKIVFFGEMQHNTPRDYNPLK